MFSLRLRSPALCPVSRSVVGAMSIKGQKTFSLVLLSRILRQRTAGPQMNALAALLILPHRGGLSRVTLMLRLALSRSTVAVIITLELA